MSCHMTPNSPMLTSMFCSLHLRHFLRILSSMRKKRLQPRRRLPSDKCVLSTLCSVQRPHADDLCAAVHARAPGEPSQAASQGDNDGDARKDNAS